MFITILARIAGVDTSSAANKVNTKFSDVKSGKYYTNAIKWASENGVVNGLTDTTFGPNAAIERQQLCVMIVNFAKHQNITLTEVETAIDFVDKTTIAKYAKDAVAICQKADIVNGYANGDFLYALFDDFYGRDGMPYGCDVIRADTTILENLTMGTARIYTALILAVPVAVAVAGAVILVKRKNR
jgi:hypothetical protein